MINNEKFMEELREEYEGTDLGDSQILTAKSIGITKEQIIELRKNLGLMMLDINRVWNEIVKMFTPVVRNCGEEIMKLMDKFNKSQVEFAGKPIKNKKGKKLKCWENKRFYQ